MVAASVKWALDIIYDLAKLAKVKPLTTPNDKTVWKKSREGTVKINVDIGFIEMDRQGTTRLFEITWAIFY
jgi:hypothetical protein